MVCEIGHSRRIIGNSNIDNVGTGIYRIYINIGYATIFLKCIQICRYLKSLKKLNNKLNLCI